MKTDTAVFGPQPLATLAFSATTASSSAQVIPPGSYSSNVVVTNTGTVPVFVEFGAAGVVAQVPTGGTPGSMPILPGQSRNLRPQGGTTMAVITATGTATVYATPGEGL